MKGKHILITGFGMLAIAAFLLVMAVVLKDQVVIVNGNHSVTSTTLKPVSVTTTLYTGKKVDDWEYSAGMMADSAGGGLLSRAAQALGNLGGMGVMSKSMTAPMQESLGFSVGGAKDINSFRENIKNNYLPIPTDITYEGLYYDYYFDTGKTMECRKLFCPSYSTAVSKDPISGRDDYYMQVGLNSGLSKADFKRKKLNLVIVLDISGSMSSQFNKYYYDQFGGRREIEGWVDDGKSKMEVATESIAALLDHLNHDDRLSIVLFDDNGYLAKPIRLVGKTDMDKLKDHILDLTPQGGTYMEKGMKLGTEQLSEYKDMDRSDYENRIIFLTDAMPNIGRTGKDSLLSITEENADNKIYTTFIGIGIDFNTELVDHITKIRGANYYSVHSSKEFKERMDDQFEYMVTPLVFNLKLKLDADGYEILKVYGSPEADEATGELMRVNTLFPSETKDGKTKGGIIVLKLRKLSDDGTLRLKASYEDREGVKDSDVKEIVFTDSDRDTFDNTGLRKGVLLARYADLMKNWVIDERASIVDSRPIEPYVTREIGLRCPMPIPEPQLGRWERQSVDLRVSSHYRTLIRDFRDHFEDEMDELGDKSLEQELDILDKLGDYRKGSRDDPVDDDWNFNRK